MGLYVTVIGFAKDSDRHHRRIAKINMRRLGIKFPRRVPVHYFLLVKNLLLSYYMV